MFGARGDIDVEGKKEEGRQRCLGDTERRATGEGVAGRRGFSWVLKAEQEFSRWTYSRNNKNYFLNPLLIPHHSTPTTIL